VLQPLARYPRQHLPAPSFVPSPASLLARTLGCLGATMRARLVVRLPRRTRATCSTNCAS
jgi:hypothetical protein